MLSLPTEIITIVAYFLEPKKRAKLREVNAVLNKLLSDRQLWQDVNNEFTRDRFQTICKTGNLHSAQWLTQTFGLTQEDARSDNNYALQWSCINGHLEVAQWLTKTFNLTQEDVKSDDNLTLRLSCQNGHLEVARWLVQHFDLIQEDARQMIIMFFDALAKNNHARIIK